MRCEKPQRFGRCRRCVSCRRTRRDELVSRILAEVLGHSSVSMVTLTYRPSCRPDDGSLSRADIVGFRKRLRINFERACLRDRAIACLPAADRLARMRLRFFTCGEYSPRGLPHFHVIIFGADRLTVVNGVPFPRLLKAAWGKGRVHPGNAWGPKAAGYCASYVTKGHDIAGLDPLGGRAPEFSMWPSPGLGVAGVAVLSELLGGDRPLSSVVDDVGDVPHVAELGGAVRALGTFLQDKLRLSALGSADRVRGLKSSRSLSEIRDAVAVIEDLPDSDFESLFSGAQSRMHELRRAVR